MRKYMLTILLGIMIFLEFTSITLHAQELPSQARVPSDFPTIQQAVDNLAHGGKVTVENGTYYEYVRAYKSLSLMATGKTIIDGKYRNYADSPWQIYVVGADNIVISGFVFLTTYIPPLAIGIRCKNCTNVTIINCTFEDTCHSGIELVGVSNALIFNNTINTSEMSILLYRCTNITVTYNTLRNADESFHMYNSRDIVFHHNNVFFREECCHPTYPRISNTTCIWDDGYKQGNYWSDYTERYPNAIILRGLNIWNTPYQIDPDDVDGREHFDYYPLVKDPQVSSDPTENGCGAGGKIPLMC